jgi:hypothetical protein
MVMAGLLWYDDDAHRPLAAKIVEAVGRYRERVGFEPTVCQLPPTQLTALEAAATAQPKRTRQAKHKTPPAPQLPRTLRLEAGEHLHPNCFLLGMGEDDIAIPNPLLEEYGDYEAPVESRRAPRRARVAVAPNRAASAPRSATREERTRPPASTVDLSPAQVAILATPATPTPTKRPKQAKQRQTTPPVAATTVTIERAEAATPARHNRPSMRAVRISAATAETATPSKTAREAQEPVRAMDVAVAPAMARTRKVARLAKPVAATQVELWTSEPAPEPANLKEPAKQMMTRARRSGATRDSATPAATVGAPPKTPATNGAARKARGIQPRKAMAKTTTAEMAPPAKSAGRAKAATPTAKHLTKAGSTRRAAGAGGSAASSPSAPVAPKAVKARTSATATPPKGAKIRGLTASEKRVKPVSAKALKVLADPEKKARSATKNARIAVIAGAARRGNTDNIAARAKTVKVVKVTARHTPAMVAKHPSAAMPATTAKRSAARAERAGKAPSPANAAIPVKQPAKSTELAKAAKVAESARSASGRGDKPRRASVSPAPMKPEASRTATKPRAPAKASGSSKAGISDKSGESNATRSVQRKLARSA